MTRTGHRNGNTGALAPKEETALGGRLPAEDSGPEAGEGDSDFGVVGVGASAGGVEALTELFHELPPETGLAFVVIQHLHREYKSFLRSLVERETAMRVVEASDGVAVEKNCVFVIPPGFDLSIQAGQLRVTERGSEGVHRPFDAFLHSLAAERASKAIAVVLSGTGSDGTRGIASIKASGGVVLVQSPESLAHDGMPQSAIDSGHVDAVLPVTGIASALAGHGTQPDPRVSAGDHPAEQESTELSEILALLLLRSGNDFTHYKQASIERRVMRRVSLKGSASLAAYLDLLREEPTEQDALFQDILINVTSFFRDSDAFETLRKVVLPALAKEGRDVFPLRVWVPGCASGEEVYSIAISIAELMDTDSALAGMRVQVFGTDIDPASIDLARQGIYPSTIETSVSRPRLARFFKPEPTGYKISASIRNMCVFAVQNVAKDPPFSKMDLVCCRNLLIYLGSALQKRVLETFHYALRPGGYLMLGISESIGSNAGLFALKDGKNKIYSRKSTPDRAYRTGRQVPAFERPASVPQVRPRPGPELSAADLADRLLMARFAPAGVLVDADLKVVRFRGETGQFLEPDPGAASLSLLKLARRDLSVPLRSAILEAGRTNQTIRRPHTFTPTGEAPRRVVLDVTPLQDPATQEIGFLVLFDIDEIKASSPSGEAAMPDPGSAGLASRLSEMERELVETREYMQSLLEAQEAANEEMQSANEEVQSTNEELQSTNEELETAKEELQSTNEELTTVNDELEIRNRELIDANSDLLNLLSSVNIPILMLQEDLCIRQFTRQAKSLLNLIDADIGRPMTDIQMGLPISGLDRIVLRVIENLISQEVEFTHSDGKSYSLNIRPYRTADNRITGAVLVFLDVTEIQSLERARRLASVVRDSYEAVIVWNLNGGIETWNPAARRLYGWSDVEATAMNMADLVPGEDLPEFKRFLKDALDLSGEPFLRSSRLTKGGQRVEVQVSASVLLDNAGKAIMMVSTERPVPGTENRDG